MSMDPQRPLHGQVTMIERPGWNKYTVPHRWRDSKINQGHQQCAICGDWRPTPKDAKDTK